MKVKKATEKYNLFETMYRAISSFYMWVDQGNSHTIAYGQVLYYDGLCHTGHDELDEIVYKLAICRSFIMSGSVKLSENIKIDVEKAIAKLKLMDLSKYNLTEYEICELNSMIEDFQVTIKNI